MARYSNPNSKYSRRKRRDEANNTYNNLDPEKKKEWDNMGCIILVIIIAFAFLLLGPKEAAKWLSR